MELFEGNVAPPLFISNVVTIMLIVFLVVTVQDNEWPIKIKLHDLNQSHLRRK
jgi:hypothetical protein